MLLGRFRNNKSIGLKTIEIGRPNVQQAERPPAPTIGD
jgi:hypothetical protein